MGEALAPACCCLIVGAWEGFVQLFLGLWRPCIGSPWDFKPSTHLRKGIRGAPAMCWAPLRVLRYRAGQPWGWSPQQANCDDPGNWGPAPPSQLQWAGAPQDWSRWVQVRDRDLCLAVRNAEVWLTIQPNLLSRASRSIIQAVRCPTFFQVLLLLWLGLRESSCWGSFRPPPYLFTPCCHSPLAALALPESPLRPLQPPSPSRLP